MKKEIKICEKISVTILEATLLTGIGRCQLQKWIDNDIEFPSFNIGNKTMISSSMLKDYINKKAKARAGRNIFSMETARRECM